MELNDIPGYNGDYKIDKNGCVISFKRKKQRILTQSKDYKGYPIVNLCNGNKKSIIRIHQLVAITFLNYVRNGKNDIIVDHIDNDKTNNSLDNLQLITNRENTSKDRNGYVGVSFDRRRNKFLAQIQINGKRKYLGRFDTAIEANNAYKNELNNISI